MVVTIEPEADSNLNSLHKLWSLALSEPWCKYLILEEVPNKTMGNKAKDT